MLKHFIITFMFFVCIAVSSVSYAGEADILYVEISISDGNYHFEVTTRHDDRGWEDFANWFRVTTEDGTEIARRVLAHPHVNEQPFTRELVPVKIPEGVKVIIVEGHDMVHGYGGRTVRIDLSKPKGQDYEIFKLK